MKRIVTWLTNRVIAWFQSRCDHNGDTVSFDILEGAHEPTIVQWCHRCGAVCVRTRGVLSPHNWRTVSPGTFP